MEDIEIKKLPGVIKGRGPLKNHTLTRVHEDDTGYVYKVEYDEDKKSIKTGYKRSSHMEVFLKRITPVCLDFKQKIFSETRLREKYPRDEDFGVWAWITSDLETAIIKLNQHKVKK